MKSRFVVSLLAAVAAVCMVGFTAGTAVAAPPHQARAKLIVPFTLSPNDLHIGFTGPAGTIDVNSVMVVPNVGTGSIAVSGDSVIVVWQSALSPGDSVQIDFRCRHAVKGAAGGRWTFNADSIGPVNPDSVTMGLAAADPVPGASPMAMLLIAMAIAAGGVVMLRRRVEA